MPAGGLDSMKESDARRKGPGPVFPRVRTLLEPVSRLVGEVGETGDCEPLLLS